MKEDIINLRKDGKTYNEISKILGCSKSTVSYHCSKLESNNDIIKSNVENKNTQEIDDITIEDLIRKARDLKMSISEISNETNLPKDLIRKICKVNGFNFVRISKAQQNLIIDLYQTGKSITYISKKINISRYTISKYLDIFEIKIKRDKEVDKSKKMSKWRQEQKRKLVEYKGGKCEICSYSKSNRALEFHHKDPSQKDFSISSYSTNFNRMITEVDKCILICANCHRELHEELELKKWSVSHL